MNKLIIEPKEINILNQCAKTIQTFIDMPDTGKYFPSFGELEIIYDTSMECSIQLEVLENTEKHILLSLYWETQDDDGYKNYKINQGVNGNFTSSIIFALAKHNEEYSKG